MADASAPISKEAFPGCSLHLRTCGIWHQTLFVFIGGDRKRKGVELLLLNSISFSAPEPEAFACGLGCKIMFQQVEWED